MTNLYNRICLMLKNKVSKRCLKKKRNASIENKMKNFSIILKYFKKYFPLLKIKIK